MDVRVGARGLPGCVRLVGLSFCHASRAADCGGIRLDGDRHAEERRRLRVPEPRARRSGRLPDRHERVRDLDPAVAGPGGLAARRTRRRAAVDGPRRALQQPGPHQCRRVVPGPHRCGHHQCHRHAGHGRPAGVGLQELRPPAVPHVRRHRRPCHHHAGAVPAHQPGWVRDGDEPLLQRRGQEPGLLQMDPARRQRHRRQPLPEVRAGSHPAGRADRLDQHAVGHLQCGAGRRDQGRPRLQEPDVHHRGFADLGGHRAGDHRRHRAARRGNRLLQRGVAVLLRRCEPVRQGHRQRIALPGDARDRHLAQPDHHHPRGPQLHAGVVADHL